MIKPEQITDIELARRAADGDEAALTMLFCRHEKFVYRVCRRIVLSHESAEDLTQIVFMRLMEKIKTFKGDSELKTWLYRFATNQCLMYLRVEKKRGAGVSLTEREGFLSPVFEMSIDDEILLEGCIRQLPPGYKKVFVLKTVYGFEHEEIASILSLSVGTCKSQFHKAREKMQRLINRQANPKFYERA